MGALADALGVEPTELRQALQDFHDQNEGEHRDAFVAALAEALDVTRAELRKASREVRADGVSAFEERRAELVAFLAERFGPFGP